MNTISRKSGMVGLVLAAAVGCGVRSDKAAAEGNSGTIGLRVVLGSDNGLSSIQWVLVCSPTSAAIVAGDWDVSHSSTVSGIIGGIPLNDTCTLVLTGTDSKGTDVGLVNNCTGMLANIAPNSTAVISVVCTDPGSINPAPSVGSIGASATVSVTQGPPHVCAGIASFTASPAEVYVGSSIALSASTTAVTDGATATTTWSSTTDPGFTATGATAAYACNAAGTQTITLSVQDSFLGCLPSTDSFDVNCTVAPCDIASISASGNDTCAVVNGGAQCWGYNYSGQLGNGSTTDSAVPVRVYGLTSGVSAVGVGYPNTCALVSGGVQCWGSHVSLQTIPVQVQGLSSGVTAIAISAGYHTCVVVNGGVKCWGGNDFGQLGDNSTTASDVPVQVEGLSSGVTAITVGDYHTCALVNGGAQCWGYNAYGQLGNNSTTQSLIPVQVLSLTAGVTAITAGEGHTCALVNGGVQCWGENYSGQLGNNSTTQSLIPVQVLGLTSGATAVAAGTAHTCALINGGVQCWGMNLYGALGNGSTINSLIPVQVKGLTLAVKNISAGGYDSCALVNGGVQCWGYNAYGQLGNNSTTSSSVPVQVQLLCETGDRTGTDCATDDDCCVVTDYCGISGQVIAGTALYLVPRSQQSELSAYLANHPSPYCTACMWPQVQVSCQAGTCVGLDLGEGSPTGLGAPHCGAIATGGASSMSSTGGASAMSAAVPAAAAAGGLSAQTVFGCP